MLYDKELRKIENELYEKGLSEEVRHVIRNCKICIIDDGIKDLKSIYDDLKREGFNNIEKHKKCPPVNQLLLSNFDLIMLDLNDVALDLSADDGLGILNIIYVYYMFI